MKRFTETAKWEDPWFRKLSPQMKLLWQWLCDRCDNAGVIDPDIDLASFQIGYQYPMDTLSGFGDRIEKLECGKWFIPKFIPFQYGELSDDCRAHKPIFMSLQKHFPDRVSNGYSKGINTLKEKEKDKDKEKDKEEDARANRKRYATHAEVATYAKGQAFPISDECIDHFFDRMEEIGWTDDKGLALADWRARFRRYATNWTNSANGRKATKP